MDWFNELTHGIILYRSYKLLRCNDRCFFFFPTNYWSHVVNGAGGKWRPLGHFLNLRCQCLKEMQNRYLTINVTNDKNRNPNRCAKKEILGRMTATVTV